jgi:thiosulfate dehydrogenase
MTRIKMKYALILLAGAATAVVAAPRKKHQPPAPQHGGTVIQMCDGETSIEVQGEMTPEKSKAAADVLMQKWREKNPHANWDEVTAQNGTAPGGPATPQNGAATTPRAAQGQAGAPMAKEPARQHEIYGSFTNRDELVWEKETEKFVAEGNAIFHDAKRLGGTISVSCDMCHPNAANTHPETYPKFQVQLGRVALLRDMINWCIENPVKGKPLHDDDDRLRALEAYILAQRKGVAMEYGKH